MKFLILMRHAKAVDGDGMEDHERPLTAIGRDAAASVAKSVAADPPQLVLCSTALRTRETLEPLLAAWDQRPIVRYEASLYLAEAAGLMGKIQQVEDEIRSLWLIGHNPGLERLVQRLSGAPVARPFPIAARAMFRPEISSWTDLHAPIGSTQIVMPVA